MYMERIVIYTYVSNGRKPVDVRNPYKNVDFFVLSKDVITRNINGWTPLNCSRYIDANGEENFKDVIFNNPFLYFKNYDYAIYVDPSTVFTHSPLNGLRSFKESRNNVLRKPNVTYFRNGEYNCIKYEENVQEENVQEEINIEEMFGYYDENDNFIEDKEYINCMEKIVLYTYSKYGDLPVRIKNKYKNVDVVLISKALTVGELNGWKVLNCKDAIEKKGKDGFEKILYERPFEIFKEYKYAVFVQPNLKYQRSPLSYLKTFIDKKLNVLRKDNIICFKNNNYKPKQLYEKSVNRTNVKDNDVAIYVAASKSDKKTNIVNNSSIRRYSWVNEGKELDSDYWCELAVIYDIWKRSKAKIVGLEHYRRFFVEPGWDGHSNDYKILEKDKIVSALNKYDVILPRQYVPQSRISVGDNYTKKLATKSLLPTINAFFNFMKSYNPDIYNYMNKSFKETGFYACNMMICKKEIFDKYCEFLFGAINEFKKTLKSDNNLKRIYGYLSEWIMGYWFEFNNYKILSTYKLVYKKDMTKVENSDWNAKTEKEKNEMFVACEKYKRSNELIKLQEVELDLMKKFDEVCKKHNINYFLIGGTLLGAARHKGFIPWDDDMDVAMLAKDYYKLLEVAKDEFNGKYFFQTEYSDPGALRYHAQLRNSETTGILKTDYMCRKKFNQGIFIDIFPFYTLPDDLKKRKEVFNYITPLLRNKNHANFVKYDNYLRNLNCNGHYCCPLWSPIVFKEITPIADVVKTIPYKFEDLMLPIPHNYNNVLVIKYGRNWRTPIKGKSIHGGLIVDTNKSYIEYIRKFN